jgi:hypothetical protein
MSLIFQPSGTEISPLLLVRCGIQVPVVPPPSKKIPLPFTHMAVNIFFLPFPLISTTSLECEHVVLSSNSSPSSVKLPDSLHHYSKKSDRKQETYALFQKIQGLDKK